MIKNLNGLNKLIAKIESAILILLLLIMILLAFAQVVLRNFFSSSILWGDILLRHLVLWVGFLGASLATKESKHINIDVLSRLLSPSLKKISGSVANLFAATICFFLMRAAFSFISYEKLSGSVLFSGIPVWIFQTVIVLGFGLMMFRFLLLSIENMFSTPESQRQETGA
jgi:TRAP-type C4-dicarboxylate transport system permease small subunit